MTTIASDERWGGSREFWAAAPSRRGRYTSVARIEKAQRDASAAVAKYGAHAMMDSVAELSGLIYKALDASATDFRLRDSLAREFNVDAAEVEAALQLLGDKVRRPVSTSGEYDDWYRLTSKGMTRRERWRRFRATVGKTNYN